MFKQFFKDLYKTMFWSGYPMPKLTPQKPKITSPKVKASRPKISMPKMALPTIQIPKIKVPLERVGLVLGAINTTILILIGSLGLLASYMNPIPAITPYISMGIATRLFDAVVYLQAHMWPTVLASVALIFSGFVLHLSNFKPASMLTAPMLAYRKVTAWRDWLLAKINYLNEESAKWKTAFRILMSPYSFLRMMGFSPQMAIGLLAVGSTAGGGVIVNETILADRSFSNGDSGIYAAPSDLPSATLEETMAWRKDNSEDNTLRIVLGAVPVREIKIENVSVGTVYANSALPSSTAHTSASGTAATSSAVLIGGTVISGGTSTYLEIGELILEKSRCSWLYFDNTTAHTINVLGNASDGQSINQTPGTSRMRAIGGGHHQAEAMVTSGGSYDRIHIDAPTTAVNGKIGKLTLSNLYTEGGACVFDRMKIGTLTISLNEIGVADGFASKDFKIHQSVTAANWNVSDNVEVAIGVPSETLSNE